VTAPRSASRRRAGLLAMVAVFCALLSAAAASRRDDSIDAQLGELRTVIVLETGLERGTPLTKAVARRALGESQVPVRFLPPDHLADPALAVGSRLVADLPAGSYLLGSHLRVPGSMAPAAGRVRSGLRPVEVVVDGGSAPAPGSRVDVLAADEPGSTSNPRVRVLVRDVELVAIEPLRAGSELADPAAPEAGDWVATLALSRGDSLRVIEADNYAREVRLLER
jgi:Flp pilus assembly protein CpaB